MRHLLAAAGLCALAMSVSYPTLALAAAPADILAANKAAMGGKAWDSKVTLKLEYDYSGQGLTGKTSSLQDLQRGAYVDVFDIPASSGAQGFDGTQVWERDTSGTVTDQAGGDVIPLAITEAYLDRNLWWRSDRGGATIVDAGQKTDGGNTYDVLTVTPKDGKPIEAWFDAKTHLLTRTIENQSIQTITTTYSDYAPVDGVMIARKSVVDDGSGNLQTITLTKATFSAALPITAYQRPAENLHDFSIAGGAHETTVPFRLLNNHVYADVSINGSKPMTFILDTGGHSILTPETAKALGVGAQGNVTGGGGGDQLVTGGVATVKSITLGGATLTDQPVTVQVFSAKGVEGVNEAGMIGYEFFSRFVTRFDYGNHTVTFIDKKSFDPKDAGTPVPMRLYHQFPEILGSYDGVPGRFGIDTGSRMALLLNKIYAANNNFPPVGAKAVAAQTGWGVGGPTHSMVFKGSTLKLGDVTIDHPLTMVSTDKGGAGAVEAFPNNVGGGILKRYAVTFDYQHSTMYLKPIAGAVDDLDTFDRAGVWLNKDGDNLKVIDLTAGAPAAEAGLKTGDVVTAVDGKPAGAIALPDIRYRLRNDAPGSVVTFTVMRAGKSDDVKVTLRDLI
jgi:hypothetical protein